MSAQQYYVGLFDVCANGVGGCKYFRIMFLLKKLL